MICYEMDDIERVLGFGRDSLVNLFDLYVIDSIY